MLIIALPVLCRKVLNFRQIFPQKGGGSCHVRAVVRVRSGRWFVSGLGGGLCPVQAVVRVRETE